MVRGILRSLLDEPAVPNPPARVWRDWALLAVSMTTVLLEGVFNPGVPWRPWSVLISLAIMVTLLWRRTHPLAVTITFFGAIFVAERLSQWSSGEPFEYYSAAFALVAPYALFRWGSGRHAAIGAAMMLMSLVTALAGEWTGVGDAIGGTLVLIAPAVIGVEVRQLTRSRDRRLEDAKTHERELLARDLHDTVAHHVSAIAIRAQAGRIVGQDDPAEALDALRVIEHEASRTLAEMRTIVGALRGTAAAELAPQPGIDDLRRLAHAGRGPGATDQIDVVVCVPEHLDEIGPTIESAMFRVAQEAITNARRHARGATEVTVAVTADRDTVDVVIDDDGIDPCPPNDDHVGFGIIGMTERATLLGGSLTAGPRGSSGWRVHASIPRRASTS